MVASKAFVLALATGFAAAKPVDRREPEALPAYRRSETPSKRQINGFGNLNVGGGNNNNNNNDLGNFGDFGNQFNRFNDQERVVQIQEQNIQIQDNGVQQAVVAQAREVLVVDQKNNNFNNLFRKANFRNQNRDQSVVMLVVQQIQVAVDQGNGNVFRQDLFAQSAVVANRGARSTRTVQIVDKRQLVATQVLNGFGPGVLGGAAPTGVAGLGNQQQGGNGTNNVGLFGSKPQWNDVLEDPAAQGAAAWQQELEDLNNLENLNNNNDENNKALEQQKQQAEEANKNQDQAAKDKAAQDQAAKDQAAKDEAAKAGEQQAGEQQQAAQDTTQQPESAVAEGNNGEQVEVAKGGKQ